MKLKFTYLFALSVAGCFLHARTAEAALIFTIEDPGVQSTTVAGASTETFDALPTGSLGTYYSAAVGGTYSGGYIAPADLYGGAGGGGMYNLVGSYTGQNSQTLTFDSSKTYFGMWWSAGDPANQLVFYDGATILASYSTADIIPFLSSAYYGNPNNGLNPNEPYVYLNFTTTGASRITSIEFNCDLFAGFESDNHSVHDQVIEPPGNTLPTVPATGSTLTMLLMGVCFITLVGAKLTGDRVFRHV